MIAVLIKINTDILLTTSNTNVEDISKLAIPCIQLNELLLGSTEGFLIITNVKGWGWEL